MADFENFHDERRKWREERRRQRDEWRAKFRDGRRHMMDGAHVRSGGIWTGVFVLLIGVAALVKASVTDLPDWVFSWQTFLIALGVFLGVRHNFRGVSWFVLMLIGGGFLIPEVYSDIDMHRYIWPAVMIIIGIFLILRPRRRYNWDLTDDEKKNSTPSGIEDATIVDETKGSKEDYVNATSVFGGAKKNILSKNFKGGEIVNIFGGTELNLSQADINGEAVIEMTTIFGGTKLIIPSNWTVKSDAAVIFGGIEDKRNMPPINDPTGKVLTLKGTVIFGGIDIKSF